MRNRLIYILIGLMIVSLIGLIIVQTTWISNSIEDREKEFTVHVNDALNSVNDHIEEDEAVLFIENKMGGMDSLMENVFFIREFDSLHSIAIDRTPQQRVQIKLKEAQQEIEKANDEIEESIKIIHEDTKNWQQKLEIRLDKLDSVLETSIEFSDEGNRHHDQIVNVVENYTTELLFSGAIEDRVSRKGLTDKIKKALTIEGITDSFDFAVYDNDRKSYVETLQSDNFDAQLPKEEMYSKTLFQNDKINHGQYQLHVQIASIGDFVWSEVRTMVILSILFTVLILFCFTYALYFIFKQKKISQIKNDFINNMTHELKTPLASISLATASIKHPEIIANPTEINRFINVIEKEEKKIHSNIEKVLNIAALDKGELKLQFTTTDLIDLLQETVQNHSLPLSTINGRCTTDFNGMVKAPIVGDAFHLVNAFSNLVDNGIKYHGDDAVEIKITVEKSSSFYTISIQDNGIGMSKRTQQLAFDTFYRAESGNIHTRKGFGIGLSYVKSIVAAHSGTCEIHSELGKGTTVVIKLPMQQ